MINIIHFIGVLTTVTLVLAVFVPYANEREAYLTKIIILEIMLDPIQTGGGFSNPPPPAKS